MKKVISFFLTWFVGVSSWASLPDISQIDLNGEQKESTDPDVKEIVDYIKGHCFEIKTDTQSIEYNGKCDDLIKELVDDEEKMAGGSICVPGAR